MAEVQLWQQRGARREVRWQRCSSGGNLRRRRQCDVGGCGGSGGSGGSAPGSAAAAEVDVLPVTYLEYFGTYLGSYLPVPCHSIVIHFQLIPVGYVTAKIGFSVDLDLHQKLIHSRSTVFNGA